MFILKKFPQRRRLYIIQMISNARKMVGQCQGAACFGLMRAALLFVHLTQSRLHGLLQQGLSGLPNESMLTAGKNDLNRFIGCAFLGVNRDENWVDHSNHSAWNAFRSCLGLLSKSRSIPYHGVSNSIAIDSVTGCYWPHFSDIKWFAPSCEQNPQVVKRHLNFLQLGLPVIIGTLPFHLSMANNCKGNTPCHLVHPESLRKISNRGSLMFPLAVAILVIFLFISLMVTSTIIS